MRRISFNVFVGASAALAVILLAAQAPVSQASAGHSPAKRTPAPRAASARTALASFIAAERLRHGLESRSAALVGGVITGFVKGVGGAPVGGVCVTATATGSARTVMAASRADGRYVLAGLHPGSRPRVR